MSNKNPCFAMEVGLEALEEDVASDLVVEGTERVIDEHDVLIPVEGAGQVDSLLLASAQVDGLLADLCEVPGGELGDVVQEGAAEDALVVGLLVEGPPEKDVVLQGRVHQEGLLRDIAHRALGPDGPFGDLHLVHDGEEQTRLPAAHLTDDSDELAWLDVEIDVAQGDLVGGVLGVLEVRGDLGFIPTSINRVKDNLSIL